MQVMRPLKKCYESSLISHVILFLITHPESGQALLGLGVGASPGSLPALGTQGHHRH